MPVVPFALPKAIGSNFGSNSAIPHFARKRTFSEPASVDPIDYTKFSLQTI